MITGDQGWNRDTENKMRDALNRMYWEEDVKPVHDSSLLSFPSGMYGMYPYGDAHDYYFMPRPAAAKNRSGLSMLRSDFPILQRRVNGHPLVWLDNAATTQKPNCVIEAVGRYYRECNSNVHRGAHRLAAEATEAYEDARESMRVYLGASSREEIVFVRGTTEAINLAAMSWGGQNLHEGDEILLTEMEHHSNIVPWQLIAQKTGAVIKAAPISDRGEIDLREYERMFTPRTRIAAAAHVSNVLGTVNPVQQMADIAHMNGALFLVDGAQSAPHLPIDVKRMGADFFALSGHKMYGPTGIGVLYGRSDLLEAMPPYQGGGGMIRNVRFERTLYRETPDKFEAGTGNIADAVGLGTAANYLRTVGMQRIRAHEQELTEYLMNGLSRIPGLTLIGTAPGKTSVVSFILDSMEPEMIANQLDQRGIAIRAGQHCAQPTLQRYGLKSTARASIGLYNTFDELDLLIDSVRELSGKYST
jgi:cysteine desulfurase/selenocysteine lyase